MEIYTHNCVFRSCETKLSPKLKSLWQQWGIKDQYKIQMVVVMTMTQVSEYEDIVRAASQITLISLTCCSFKDMFFLLMKLDSYKKNGIEDKGNGQIKALFQWSWYPLKISTLTVMESWHLKFLNVSLMMLLFSKPEDITNHPRITWMK